MPKKGYKQSLKHRQKLSLKKKGSNHPLWKVSWNKESGYSITFKGEKKPNSEIDKMEIKE